MKDKPADIRELLTAQSIAAYRERVIEECAQMVADWDLRNWDHDCDFKDVLAAVAAAIRALKDKP